VVSLSGNKRNIFRPFIVLVIVIMMSGFSIRQVYAHVIDRIEINQVGDEAEIQIKFDVKIQFLRHASLNNGEIHLYLNLLEADPDSEQLIPEALHPPPSNLTKHFSIVYPALDSSLVVRFDEPTIYRVTAGRDGRSISVFTPALIPKSEDGSQAPVVAPVVQLTQADIEKQAQAFIDTAKYSIQHDQLEVAIETLNRLLLLPPNLQSQTAQELIGEARELNGEIDKARSEYETYIKIYPEAADIEHVKDRLAHLPKEAPKTPKVSRAYKQKYTEEPLTVYGGLSQYYYKGVSHTDTSAINPDFTTTTSSRDATDQSQLLTNLDVTARKRTETTETRLVLRDYYNANYLRNQPSYQRLSNLYIEHTARDRSYLVRAGRQNGSGGGVLGNFDGAVVGYELNQNWRINGVAGTPVEYVIGGSNPNPKKTFAGVSLDLTRLPDQWSGSGYFIQQQVEGFIDRQAFGMEAHYFDVTQNYMVMTEYDRKFKTFNLVMLQRNWTSASSTNFNMLMEHRRAPPLQLTNGLVGQPVQSVELALRNGFTLDKLRADALALSMISNQFGIGFSHPYSPRLRLGGDFRVYNTTGTGATTLLPASPGSGNTYTYSFNALGNNLLFENDLTVVNATYTNAQTYKGQLLSLTQVETFKQNWRIDFLLQLYNQNTNQGVHQTQARPSVKLNYRLNKSFSVEGETGIELYHTSSAIQNDKTSRKYFYVGYRWDF